MGKVGYYKQSHSALPFLLELRLIPRSPCPSLLWQCPKMNAGPESVSTGMGGSRVMSLSITYISGLTLLL